MKKILVIVLMSLFFNSYAHSFTPASGMKFSCYDSVSNYKYALKIVDIGDEEGEASVYNKKKLIEKHESTIFNENTEESFFLVYKEGRELFSVKFPQNDLKEAIYQDGGDSRSLDCKIVR